MDEDSIKQISNNYKNINYEIPVYYKIYDMYDMTDLDLALIIIYYKYQNMNYRVMN
jgi:hypothetical protein